MSQTTPADDQLDPVSPAPDVTDVTPEEPIEDQKEPENLDAPAPSEDEQATLKKRLSGALQENEKKGEELRKALRIQAEMVRESPNYIHRIAQEDPSMANKVIQEVWGNEGIRSYKQLQEHIKLQEVKDTDPEAYETKKELLEVKSKLEAKEQREKTRLQKRFLKEKGFSDNSYDPTYQKLEEALSFLNPKVVQDDYEEALKLAWNIVTNDSPIQPPSPKPSFSAGGGVPATPPINPSNGKSEFSWAYDMWKKQK